MHAVLTSLARLAGQPLLIDADSAIVHAARVAGLVRRALSAAPEQSLFPEIQNSAKPWEAREQPRIIGSTAIIPVQGMLVGGFDPVLAWCLDCCRYEAIQSTAIALGARSDIRTVIFDIGSPGGHAIQAQETTEIVQAALADKLTIAWTGSKNCSAAYYLSTACQRIIASPSSVVANVGTKFVYNDYSKMFAEAGVDVKVFATGSIKGALTQGTALTAEQESFVQSWIDDIGAPFLAAVKAARPAVAEADLQGQWFTGARAVERGFADATALSLDEILAELAKHQGV